MRVLIIGGTGLISTGIVTHLVNRGAHITMFNRGQRESIPQTGIEQLQGDRNDFGAFERLFEGKTFDVVIDMICYNAQQAESDVRAFGKHCEHFIFCSTVCTYGVKVPPNVLVDENFPQEPISDYGRNKLACEKVFMRAHREKRMNVTIIRPSSTYGPGGQLIDNLESNPASWDRIQRGLPMLCSGDGLGLWVSTHRDDCGKLFAYGALNPKTYGQSYNATRDRIVTWRDLYREASQSLGRTPKLLFMPAGWIVAHDPKRFSLLREITQFHGAYSSEKAKRDVPEFRCEIDYVGGSAATLDSIRKRGAWRDSTGDELYQSMVDKALAAGVEPIERD